MKALAIESAISCISIAAKNNEKEATLSLDVGMHQSEKLLPTIDFSRHVFFKKSALMIGVK